MKFTIPVPENFNFERTVLSHGWCALPPFHFDKEKWTLTRILSVGEKAKAVSTRDVEGGIEIAVDGKISAVERNAIIRDLRHIFRLDDDMTEFYRLTSQFPEFHWIEKEGAGRLLRSPTVFEDLFKLICTTNCSWSLTERMIDGVMKLSDREFRSFPSPEQLAKQPLSFFEKISAGYRAPFLKSLAQQTASGKLAPERWLHWNGTADELKKEMKKVLGVGDYVAENMLKLVGQYDGLALDSWIRKKFQRFYGNGRKISDASIARRYKPFGNWKGLALWCDMTRDWLDPATLLQW